VELVGKRLRLVSIMPRSSSELLNTGVSVLGLAFAALFHARTFRRRRAWITVAVALMLVSSLNRYQLCRLLTSFGCFAFEPKLPPIEKSAATRCGWGVPVIR